MAYSVYIADDEKNIRELLKSFLESEGYLVETFDTGDRLLKAFEKTPSDLVILDIMMPGSDGIECVKKLRKSNKPDVPIILLTAKDSEMDYVQGITLGSDDYLTKPFRPTMLLMRVKALLRRVEMQRNESRDENSLSYLDLSYSPDDNIVYCNGISARLTKMEMKVLLFMMRRPEKTHSRDDLLDEVWGYSEDIETRAIDETIHRIRKKLLLANSNVMVSTVWGYGYKLISKDE